MIKRLRNGQSVASFDDNLRNLNHQSKHISESCFNHTCNQVNDSSSKRLRTWQDWRLGLISLWPFKLAFG